jgi:hypothetical protein
MKNATKHAADIKALINKAAKGLEIPEKPVHDPIKALVLGALLYNASDKQALDALAAFEKEFVDFNELRVATELEVQDLLGEKYPQPVERVEFLIGALNHIFNKEHTLSLNRMKGLKVAEIRVFLEEFPDAVPFVTAYVMLYGYDSAAFPIDDDLLDYLLAEELLEEGTTVPQAQAFLEGHLKADEMHKAYVALRSLVVSRGRKKAAK